MRNSRSNNRGPKKAGTTNRFAEGSRGPRSFDNDDRAGAGKKEFKGGAANFKRVKRRSAEDIASTSGEMRLNPDAAWCHVDADVEMGISN